jgi:uncharacterized protein
VIYLTSPATADLGAAAAKPTALTPGLMEAATSLWEQQGRGVDVGVWECTPGVFTARRDGYTEVCQLLSGRVTITVDGGEPVTLTAGDTLVMPSGWVGTWDVHETVRKVYVTIDDVPTDD